MGNAISPCCQSESTSSVKLIFYEGSKRILTGKRVVAGEIMFEFPEYMVCHADSFFIGHPVPALAIDDELMKGQTYFVLPITCFTRNVLSSSCLAALGSKYPKPTAINFKDCPFEYLKGSNGRVLIKVMPEFITKLITKEQEIGNELNNPVGNSFLCSTPELQKHYNQLVGCNKDYVWSPNLETISEYKIRSSPCRFMGLEWKQKEAES
ncbi:Hypothetical predicted protein [Olea europaea subsp. europaea]|uniref:Uncharacterized protein n=1 Tax=Olea europaea subsp. europaea TaxID=158383 RepID=A0A8S0SYR1_OLEEU|nr:Hypothetical predicted protein [Olea europaea subsp. europaea]